MPYGTGLDTAFNQDEPQQNINTHPKKVKTPEGLEKQVDYDKIQHLKVGETVAYSKGQGTIVRKDGAYVTIFNEDANAHDQVHAGETYIPGDTISMGIMNQLWDQMNYETRMASLHKAEVQEPLHFVDRKWNELPLNLKDVIKLSPSSVSYGSGYKKRPTSVGGEKQQEQSAYNPGQGYAGGGGTSRTFTPGGRKTKPKENKGPESKRTPAGEGAGAAAEAAAARSTGKKPDPGAGTFAQGLDKATNYGELATEIYKLRNQLNKQFLGGKEDPFDKKLIGGSKKSDVEHGAYGGVVTDTNFDAEGDYEEDKRDVHGKEFDHNHQQKTPRDPKEEGDEVLVGYHSKEGGTMSTGTAGANNALYDEKDRERSIRNKYNSRYGVRKATQEDIDRLTK